MSTVGFLYNLTEGKAPKHPFFYYRAAPMRAYLEQHGIGMFVFSPRHVDRATGEVTGLVRTRDGFESLRRTVPEVCGNWYMGADISLKPGGMSGRAFRIWARKRGLQVYPDLRFIDRIRDKFLTYELIANIDPALHPHTEVFDGTVAQVERLLQGTGKVFLKPTLGNKGNEIAVISGDVGHLALDYYDLARKTSHAPRDCAHALEILSNLKAQRQYVIQEGIALATHADAKFILRVIMLNSGERWDWVHKVVLAAPRSEIANTTQGGSNHVTEAFLGSVYGADRVAPLMAEVRRACFETVERMDAEFDHGLMEVGYDLVIDEQQRVLIVEVNTRPGMTKPGLPMPDAFVDIYRRSPEEERLYQQFVAPHGTRLAQFLHTKEMERQQRASTSGFIGAGVPELDPAIRAAAGYLAGACRSDGMFVYRVNPDGSAPLAPRYNVMRHAGAIYALCRFLERRPTPEVLEAVRRATLFLRDRCLAPVDALPGCAGIWSLPQFEVDGKDAIIKLGAVGLGLLGLLRARRHGADCVSLEQLRALGHFLLSAQHPDGHFAAAYRGEPEGFEQRTSLHYPGQAVLALIELWSQDPDPRWLEAGSRALTFLARSRAEATNTPADYWAMLATAELLAGDHPIRAGDTGAQPELIDHAVQICTAILQQQTTGTNEAGVWRGFSAQGRTIPTAHRLQGLLAALRFLPDDARDLREQIHVATGKGVGLLLRAQVRDGPYRGGIPRAIGILPGGAADALRFNRRAGEIRIDYVQHALCAWLQYDDLRTHSALTPVIRG